MNNQPSICFSITSCKRIDLFKRTINSFINTCQDLSLISKCVCVDDNSDEGDREEMQAVYPFFNFIFKGEKQKGHAISMNIIREQSKTCEYLLHIEDDWSFLSKTPYISKALEILDEDEKYGQVVFNRNYAELADPEYVDLAGGFDKLTKEKNRYVLHEFHPKGSEEEAEFYKRNPNSRSSCYWPHFSLNPSVIKTNVFSVGEFNEEAKHFEMEFAGRYVEAGWKTCFFDDIYCSHIGRKIKEAGDPDKKNAYELNKTTQF